MNVLLINTNQNRSPTPVMPAGACMVADAAVRAGHRVRLLDLMFIRDVRSAIESAIAAAKPDVVGLSIRNIDNNDMHQPVFFLRELESTVRTVRECTTAPIVLGGAALGVMPEEILKQAGVSLGVVGDGETVFPELLDGLDRDGSLTGLAGIAVLEKGAFRLHPASAARFNGGWIAPDYRRWIDVAAYQSQLAAAPVQTKIGCPFRCVYCTYRKIDGEVFRFAEPESVADAVARLTADGLQDIEFVDSVFNEPREHALAVCNALARAGNKSRLQSVELNPRSFDDELVVAMKRAGFISMGITVESASDRVLQCLKKGFTSREVHRAAEIVRRHRLPCAWIFLLGGPGETSETVKETLQFARAAVRPQDIAFFNIGVRIYPGTELESIARGQGVLSLASAEMLPPVFYVSPEVDLRWMEQELKESLDRNMNFITNDSFGLSFLPTLNRLGSALGVRPPLWRYTRYLRRGLRLAGLDV